MDRQTELVRQEAQRRRAFAELDEPRRLEHLEVAEALRAAANALERDERLCRSEISLPSPRPRSRRSRRARCRGRNRCRGR